MAIPHAAPTEVIDVRPLGVALKQAFTKTLVKTETLEVIRIVVPAGKHFDSHRVAGEITVQCLEGRIQFTADGTQHELASGQMLYLAGRTEHSLEGIKDSAVLLTILLG